MDDDAIRFMRRAIALSREGMAEGGGPFGAVVVRDKRILGEGKNAVVPQNDPTAHAEIVAIRAACRQVRSYSLAGSVLYTSCEPCPMCLAAIWWARIDRICFGNTRFDAQAIGFDDAAIYAEVARPLEARVLPMTRLLADEAEAVFREWRLKDDKISY